MTRYRRDKTPGASWFFTVVTYQRRELLCDKPVRIALRNAISRVRIRHPFVIDAWILLPNHFHCIWTLPDGESNYSLRWKLIKSYVTRACGKYYLQPEDLPPSKTRRRESVIWQRRFWEHRIKNEKDYALHMDYLHYNPVKHGYCKAPSKWRYSTLHRLKAEGIYPEDWGECNSSKMNMTIDCGEI